MQAHVPTIFLIIVTLSFSLAIAIAGVSLGRKQGLTPWAAGMALHGVAYLLFSLRGEVSDFLSIVVANTALGSTFALFTDGLRNFNDKQPRSRMVWAPVLLILLGFSLLVDHMQARSLLSSAVYLFQSLLLAYCAYRSRGALEGRGQYVIVTGALLLALVMLARLVGVLTGQFNLPTITTANPLQTLTFVVSVISTLLVVIGVLLMTWERDEQLIRDSEIRLRTLFESASDAVILVDDRGFFDCNSATLKMFGCASKAEFVQKTPADLSPAQQPDGSDSEQLAQQQMAIARRKSSNRFEWVYQRLDNGQCFAAEVLLDAMSIHGKEVLQTVVRDITERKQLQQDLERQAHLDHLTALYNRGHFMHLAELEVARAARYRSQLSLLMIDIDNFKAINDTHGHKAGDLVLKKLGEVGRKALRKVDIIGRIGGEEFAVLLPETSMDGAMLVAERLRLEFTSTKVGIDQGLPLTFTVSIGVSALSPSKENLDELMSLADKALYVAKESGRNRVAGSVGAR